MTISSVEWEVAPTKDVVGAFIETLVDPKIPYMDSLKDTPSIDVQRSIARQMHAVVLLYNYYHRTQKPELEFLDFVPFCKLALSIRPKLKPFMRTMERSEAVEFSGSEDSLSTTERAVKSACDIAKSLDASKDVPITKGYPISTVAVLLVDSEKENCLLKYNAVTEGVWSVIEKEVDELGKDQEMLSDERVHKKRKITEEQPLSDHSKFLRIAFDAVMDASGIEVSDLEVLEAHVVYSLRKEKSAAQFYIMKGNKSLNPKEIIALESLVESLSGPFANNYDGSWVSSDLVEYQSLLPYARLIATWLRGKDSSKPILTDCVAQIIKSKEEPKTHPSRGHTPPHAEYSVEDMNYIRSNSERMASSLQKVAKSDIKSSWKKGDESSGCKVASRIDESQRRIPRDDNAPKSTNDMDIPFLNEEKEKTKPNPNRRNDAEGRPLSTVPFSSSGEEKKSNARKRSYHQIKNISSTENVENGDTADQNRGKSLTIENADAEAEEDEGVNLAAQYNMEVKNVIMQNALALVERERQELYSRICNMEERLAVCEHVIDRIRDGEDVGLARRTIKHIVDGNGHLLQNEIEAQKQTTFPDFYFPGASPIQDLQCICRENDWRLPRYLLQPSSNGAFVSSVVAQCAEKTVGAKGSEEATPFKARESAAAQMIAKMKAHINTLVCNKNQEI